MTAEQDRLTHQGEREKFERRFSEPGPVRDVALELFEPLSSESYARVVCDNRIQTAFDYVRTFAQQDILANLADELQRQGPIFEAVRTLEAVLASKPGQVADAHVKIAEAIRILQGFPHPAQHEIIHLPTVQHYPLE